MSKKPIIRLVAPHSMEEWEFKSESERDNIFSKVESKFYNEKVNTIPFIEVERGLRLEMPLRLSTDCEKQVIDYINLWT
ncbi:hypothetical protein SAMN05421839_10581 [Halolactibacillus halophilus]|uniref:Uncharacterized protein n=1 Tax=Halolactibacillus halophilus TaxID=306540 RepID=A0A1I5MIE2_9BACI|nr:hypothetical protein [Halolactibacillus halophilus]GEM02977.1 hypothetical protein HHA03_25090 [Halolactibacillus halophilus]SFP08726.1 hypothetical protein SAMN05421839_10581 [Halolactibacillus halophilus]